MLEEVSLEDEFMSFALQEASTEEEDITSFARAGAKSAKVGC